MRGTTVWYRIKQDSKTWEEAKCILMAELIDQVERVADAMEAGNKLIDTAEQKRWKALQDEGLAPKDKGEGK